MTAPELEHLTERERRSYACADLLEPPAAAVVREHLRSLNAARAEVARYDGIATRMCAERDEARAEVARLKAERERYARRVIHGEGLTVADHDAMRALITWAPPCTGEHDFANATCRACGYVSTGADFLAAVDRMHKEMGPEASENLSADLLAYIKERERPEFPDGVCISCGTLCGHYAEPKP